MGPEWVAFTRIVLLDTPHLDGAKCRGHWQLFDRHTHNDPNREIDEAIAVQMCATCPALLPCKQWLASLPPYLRPAGVVAGQLQPLPKGSLSTGRSRGRPRRLGRRNCAVQASKPANNKSM
jgi:hypothetical protein